MTTEIIYLIVFAVTWSVVFAFHAYLIGFRRGKAEGVFCVTEQIRKSMELNQVIHLVHPIEILDRDKLN